MNRFGWFALVGGFLALVTLILVARYGRDPRPVQPKPKVARTSDKASHYIPPKDPGPAASATEIEKAVDEAQVQSTYLNFRTAVATGNQPLRDALQKVLMKNQSTALRLAQDDLANSKTPVDQEIAQKAMEALRP